MTVFLNIHCLGRQGAGWENVSVAGEFLWNNVIFLVRNACADVVKMFGVEAVEILTQKEIDEQVQAVIYQGDTGSFIAHHDRPYVVNLGLFLQQHQVESGRDFSFGRL